jgi:hypothetical protein
MPALRSRLANSDKILDFYWSIPGASHKRGSRDAFLTAERQAGSLSANFTHVALSALSVLKIVDEE